MKHARNHNIKLGIVTLLIPLVTAGVILVLLAQQGAAAVVTRQLSSQPPPTPLPTPPWVSVAESLLQAMPKPERQFAYYLVRNWQTPEQLAQHFGLPLEKLIALNPGPIVPGVTIKIPPIETPFSELPTTRLTPLLVEVIEANGILTIRGKPNVPLIVTTIPELAAYLRTYGVLTEVAPRHWRLEKPLFIEQNIRLDVTKQTIDRLELRSEPNNIVCLCLENSKMLIKEVTISSVDPATSGPDIMHQDQRSYIRARRNSRLDILNADISYLGNGIMKLGTELQEGGGTYGVSWRIPDGTLGQELATGWVEGTKFHHNHFGSYTFGASGMTWKNNHYYENDVYGLDPHDDSNNALVEGNLFENNGKHGFIVSKRCNNNIIRNNISRNNKLHGFMLHQDSQFNLVEHNTAEGNVDNMAIYHSNYNVVRNNEFRNAKASNVRINNRSTMNFIVDNTLQGGQSGVYAYEQVAHLVIYGNTIETTGRVVKTRESLDGLLIMANKISRATYDVREARNIILEQNETTIR